jgi:predicted transposase/invertase (TIGR01784 family)
MDYAKEKAKEEGILEGERKKQLEIAKRLLEAGMSFDFISETTGLSIDTLEGF